LGLRDIYQNYFSTGKNSPPDAYYDPFPGRKKFDPSKHRDGLHSDWPKNRIAFVNGPYSKNAAVVKKCKEQALRGVEIFQICKLVSAATFYAAAAHSTGVQLVFLPCGIAFQGHSGRVANFKSLGIHYTVNTANQTLRV
jgi:hypothetical protein